VKLRHVGYCIGALIGAALFLLALEAASMTPHYESEMATVRMVEPDAAGMGGYVGERERTWVRFDDGFTRHYGGNLGAPGDRVRVYRPCGTDTMFGILARRER
jgi:hypothetical protein